MIIRNLELTVNDDRATLNEEVVIYLGDNGICLHVALKQVKYRFNTQMVCSFEAIEYCDSCEVIVQKPNEEIFVIPKTEVINNLVHIYIDNTWTDALDELGEHRMQIILYDKNDSRITLPSVAITVLRPLLFNTGTDILTEDGIDLLNENRANGIRISELEETPNGNGFIPIVVGGKTRKYELDVNSFAEAVHTHEEYLVEADTQNFVTKPELDEAIGNIEIDGSLYATKDELATGLSGKADKEHTHDYATENFVKNEIAKAQLNGSGNEVDLSGFATKDELNAKADKEHTHSQYLTQHQDISHLALKSELHSHSNKATLDTITDAKIAEWDNKSDFSGNYNDLTNKPTIPTKTSQLNNDSGYLTTIPTEYLTESELEEITSTLEARIAKLERLVGTVYPYDDCDIVVIYQLDDSDNNIRLDKIDYSKPCYINGVEIESINGEYIEYTLENRIEDNIIEFITLKLINLKPSPILPMLGGTPCIASIKQMRIPELENLNGLFRSAFTTYSHRDIYSWQPQYFEFHPNPTSMAYMFSYCHYLSDEMMIKLMPYFPSTSNVTDMSYMFENCHHLTSSSLNVSNFDTSKVTDMSYMFHNCNSLTSLDLSNFDTSNVTDMMGMFGGCFRLTSLDISSFNTSKVTKMSGMFSTIKVASLDLSSFDTSNVTDIGDMFSNCSELTSLNISSFNTSNVTEMCWMFDSCSSLTLLDLSSFNTSNATDMAGMFEDCISLTSLDLSNFNTSKVTRMSDMFNGCSSLKTLDLRNFDTSSVKSITGMFNGVSDCTIYIGEGWTLNTTSNAYGGTNLTFIRV